VILLDTDICLSLLYGSLSSSSFARITGEDVSVSFITAAELFYAANCSSCILENRLLTEKFLLTVTILHPDLVTQKHIAELCSSLRKKQKSFCLSDVILFCTAKSCSARLVTSHSERYCFT
jgi:predicted nucleic acid-binding protein